MQGRGELVMLMPLMVLSRCCTERQGFTGMQWSASPSDSDERRLFKADVLATRNPK
jgi:hypothetical protein